MEFLFFFFFFLSLFFFFEKNQLAYNIICGRACNNFFVFHFHLVADTKHYPVFVGHRPGRNSTQRHKLDIQLIVTTNRTLYIAARSVCLPSKRVGQRTCALACKPQDFKSAVSSRDRSGSQKYIEISGILWE